MRYPALVFVHGTSFYSRLIQFGQAWRYRGDKIPFTYWTHVAIQLDDAGTVVEALGRGVVERNMHRDWNVKTECVVVELPQQTPLVDLLEMRAFALSCVGWRYGWLTIITIALHLLLGGKLTLGLSGEEICSGLVARMLERGSTLYVDPATVMPADLAQQFRVAPRHP